MAYSSPTTSHVDVEVSQDAVQVWVLVVSVTAVVEDQASFELAGEQVVHLGFTDPSGNHHLRNLCGSKFAVTKSRRGKNPRIESALLNQGLVAEQSRIVRIHVRPHSAARRIIGQSEIPPQMLLDGVG